MGDGTITRGEYKQSRLLPWKHRLRRDERRIEGKIELGQVHELRSEMGRQRVRLRRSYR